MKKALIVQGGWDGHEPVQVSEVYKKLLEKNGFEVEVSNTLDAFLDESKLKNLNIIIPIWTMGEIKNEQARAVLNAVESGVGIAGCHGGMCDAFRNNVDWQFMTGGQWVAHPGGGDVEYIVNIKKSSSNSIIEGIDDFKVKSEQYYVHIDPAIEVLATTRFPTSDGPHSTNGAVDVPVVWSKRWGQGKVFYTSLGHNASIFDSEPIIKIVERGLLWAAK